MNAISHWSTLMVDIARLALWLILLSLLFIPLERWFAVHRTRLSRREMTVDLAMYFVNSMLPAAILGVLMSAVAAGARLVIPAAVPATLTALPLAARLVLALLIAETGFYWGHRLSHRLPWLWRFHSVHHAPEHLYYMVNTHAHPVDMIFTRLCGMTPLYCLGLNGGVTPVLVVLIGTVWGFFIHSNLRVRLGPLEWLVATPAFHHWHHTKSAPLNRNFASTLPLMDLVFGTWHLPASWPQNYGIADQETVLKSANATTR
ncbi:sterol desaturase family protein [Duganella sp. PWIR1]